jgi:hypothetical protein
LLASLLVQAAVVVGNAQAKVVIRPQTKSQTEPQKMRAKMRVNMRAKRRVDMRAERRVDMRAKRGVKVRAKRRPQAQPQRNYSQRVTAWATMVEGITNAKEDTTALSVVHTHELLGIHFERCNIHYYQLVAEPPVA